MTRRHRNVYRYEHNFFRGWVVSVKRAGARHGRYFSDSAHGSRGAALEAALVYRNKLLAALPMPSKVKKSYVLNKTGVVGAVPMGGPGPKSKPQRGWRSEMGHRIRPARQPYGGAVDAPSRL